jgi:hypothetical protein
MTTIYPICPACDEEYTVEAEIEGDSFDCPGSIDIDTEACPHCGAPVDVQDIAERVESKYNDWDYGL